MLRPRSNCSVIWLVPSELVRGHGGQAGDLAELAFQRGGDQGLDRFGAGAGELGGDQDGGEVDLRQGRDGQGAVAERAGQQDGERQQPGGDRAGDERGGDGAQGGALWARWVASCGGGTEAGAWRCTDRRGVRCWRGGSTTAAAPTTTMRWQAVARGAAGNEVGAFGPRLICFRIRLASTRCEIMLAPVLTSPCAVGINKPLIWTTETLGIQTGSLQ